MANDLTYRDANRVNDRGRSEAIKALKQRTQAIEARLQSLNRRIREIKAQPRTFLLKAVVDSDICVGCGICEDQCPAGAIVIEKTATIHRELCIGCGQCVYECPRGAISLCPVGQRIGDKLESFPKKRFLGAVQNNKA